MEYEKICDEILECDKKIRYVGVYDYGELYDKMRSGLKSYLSREETKLSYRMQCIDGQHAKNIRANWETYFCISKI